MTDRVSKRAFAARPAAPDAWVRAQDVAPPRGAADTFSARLTIDATPELRGRIKIAAFRRGETVADMLRALLLREFPDIEGPAS